MGKSKRITKNHSQSKNIKSQLKVNSNRLEKDTFIFQSDLTIAEFAKAINRPSVDIIKIFFNKGIMINQNALLTEEQIGELCLEFDLDFKKEKKVTAENLLENYVPKVNFKSLKSRPPIVTIMGHVDHGKTTLLDKIRNSDIASLEKGGITQHIGAYKITTKTKKNITFIDTPGHEVFSEMRARGSQVTDIAIIVVAADDGIKPQTIEAIDHAKAADVPIIIFINKIDKPNIDIDKILNDLSTHNLMIEEWGGNIPVIRGSAKSGKGIDDLLEHILLLAEVLELKANPSGFASGVVIEATLDKFLGPSATLLVKSGKLNKKDFIVVGFSQGRIRTIINDKNTQIDYAFPSDPVRVLGLNEVPKAGDYFMCFYDEKLSKKIAQARKREFIHKDRNNNPIDFSLEMLNKKIKDNKLKTINLILKTDTFGSVEALKKSINKIEVENVKINIIRSSVGSITDTDVTLAIASNAIIIGFNVRPPANIMKKAEANKVKINLYTIIYKVIEELELITKGLNEPKKFEKVLGHAEVRQIFKHSQIGTIAGCMVIDGKVQKGSMVRILRDGKIIYIGEMNNLKYEKNDIKESSTGKECGITIKNFNDIKVNDIIESYSMVNSEE